MAYKKQTPGVDFVNGKKANQIKQLVEKVMEAEVTEVREKNGLPMAQAKNDSEMARYSDYWNEIVKLPMMDIESPTQVKNRCEKYFELTAQYEMKPSLSQLANALCISRAKLYNIHNRILKTFPEKTAIVIDRYYNLVEGASENLAQDGKIPPVVWIFGAKNNFGYKDSVEIVATDNRSREVSADDLIKEANMMIDDGALDGEGTVE